MAVRARLINGLLESLDTKDGNERRKAAARQFRADVQTYIEEEFGQSWGTIEAEERDEAIKAVSIVYCVIGKEYDGDGEVPNDPIPANY